MLNHTTIMGRLVHDPELRRTNSGKAVTSFTIACDKPGKDSGASFIPCVAWDKTAEFVDNYFTKGSAIIVEARVESRQYETKDGQKRTVVELVVSQAHFCEKKNDNSAQQNNNNAGNFGGFAPITEPDDELPF